MNSALQSGFAQSPPRAERNGLIWSNHDLSLRRGDPGSGPDTESSLQLPQSEVQGGVSDGRQGQVLACEPGRFEFSEPAAAPYVEAWKQQLLQEGR